MNLRMKRKMNKKQLIQFLLDDDFLLFGYHWIHKYFKQATAFRLKYYGINDELYLDSVMQYAVYVLAYIEAPNQSLKILKELTTLNPFYSDAYFQMIECYLDLDDLASARKILDECVRNQWIPTEGYLDFYQPYIAGTSKWDAFSHSGMIRESTEFLLDGDTTKALDVLGSENNFEAQMQKLCVLGVQNKSQEYLELLEAIIKSKQQVFLDYKFWFFQPEGIRTHSRFIQLMLSPAIDDFGVAFS
jgi:tetratricopeptide (TPR) repeat protein